MNKQYIDLLDDAYNNYSKESETKEIWNEDGTMTAISPASHYNFLSQEEFINKIKTDDEFAKKWGIVIEVTELTYKERWFLMYNETFDDWNNKLWEKGEVIIPRCSLSDEWTKHGIPTKQITVTYNRKVEIIYE